MIILGAFFFSLLAQAADTITIDGTTYTIAKDDDYMASWFSQGENPDDVMKTIYFSGLKGVFCSSPIYQNLLKNLRGGSNGPEVMLFDSVNGRIVPTGIVSVSYENPSSEGCFINGKILGETNSICFDSPAQFFRWIDAHLNKIK